MYYYQHTQYARLMPAILTSAVVVMAFMLIRIGTNPVGVAMCFLLLLLAGVFSRLTVTVDDEVVRLRYGLGLLGRTFRLSEIKTARPVRTAVLDSVGIHWTANGWLYNVAGRRTVRLDMKDGNRAAIGTDDPDGLVGAIAERIALAQT